MLGWCSHHTRRSRTIVHVSMVHATLLNKDKRRTLIIRLQQCTRVSQNSTLTIYRQPKIIIPIPISSGSPCPCSTAACGSIIFSIYDCCAVRLEDGLSDVCVITIERGGKKNNTCTLVIAFFYKKKFGKDSSYIFKRGRSEGKATFESIKRKKRGTSTPEKNTHVFWEGKAHEPLQQTLPRHGLQSSSSLLATTTVPKKALL